MDKNIENAAHKLSADFISLIGEKEQVIINDEAFPTENLNARPATRSIKQLSHKTASVQFAVGASNTMQLPIDGATPSLPNNSPETKSP
jgi:hypothetical protein